MSNRLAAESSPYLLQHAENPVDWFPWGSEALEKAKADNKPIFLSIGYSACHWCHVMEHESFENDAIASYLNQHFVSIKVDREERPDLDQIYMQAVMALQRGQGGWPLSAFLTPDCHVFFGGTYWPPHDSRGMPGFDRVLKSVLEAFQNRRDQVDEQSAKVTEYLQQQTSITTGESVELNDDQFQQIGESLKRIFDFEHGGFGRAPKFPHPMDLQVLMRLQFREVTREQIAQDSAWTEMVHLNLEKMALGGIYDHLGGGFARYSVDEKWLVPHFEKMLYDNALLSDAYLDALTLNEVPLFRRTVAETFAYQLNYMTDPLGGFHSTEDADSEGEEGKFYVWTPAEIIEALGEQKGKIFCDTYGVTESGNFEGRNILNLKSPLTDTVLLDEMKACREQLLAVRDRRVRPGKDDKVLISWNAMMIHSMAKGSMILGDADLLPAAIKAATFIETRMKQNDGVALYHTFRNGTSSVNAYLDDYACYIYALITLYECTGDNQWLERAVELTHFVVDEFHDPNGAGFFFTANSAEKLIARSKEFQDSSIPSGNGTMVCALARLYRLTGLSHLLELAQSTVACGQELVNRAPSAAGRLICGMDMLAANSQEIVVFCAADEVHEILRLVYSRFHPNRVIVPIVEEKASSKISESLIAGKSKLGDAATVYLCENYSCKSPIVGWDSIREHFSNSDVSGS